MSLPTFSRFLTVASQYSDLLRDLSVEEGLVSRATLLNYFDQQKVVPTDKGHAIESLLKIDILVDEGEEGYTLNPVVGDVINYYERRGRLTHAGFLRDQIMEIGRLTDELQLQFYAKERTPYVIADTIDTLYRLVREVRESGNQHYIGCMFLFGELQRAGNQLSIDQRLTQMETIQRRHIAPLGEIIELDGEYAEKIRLLRRRLVEVGQDKLLLAESQELTGQLVRLTIDLVYIDRTLLVYFINAADTARALIKSLLEEKKIKTAVATCLANLPAVWSHLRGKTVLTVARRTSQLTDSYELTHFFAEVLYHNYLPNPVPLTTPEPMQSRGETYTLSSTELFRAIQSAGKIDSWPRFVVQQYATYPTREQLRVLTFPLAVGDQRITIGRTSTPFQHTFPEFTIHLDDFSLKWSHTHG